MSESRPNPASATDRAFTAATARMMIPGTFHPSVAHSRAKPLRTRPARAGSLSSITQRAWQTARPGPGRNPLQASGLERGASCVAGWVVVLELEAPDAAAVGGGVDVAVRTLGEVVD